MKLNVNIYDAGGLQVQDGKKLVAEASDFNDVGFRTMPLYDDAVDVGIALRNPKTGNVTRWYLSNTDRDADYDVRCWEFKPTPESVRAYPRLVGWKVIIYND